MPALELKSVANLLGTPISYAYAVKAGPWIFLNGHEAFDFAGGIPEAVAGPTGFPLFGRSRNRRESDFILQRMRRILRELGSDLTNGVRLDQYYPTPKAVDPYHLARHAEFGDYIPPAPRWSWSAASAPRRRYRRALSRSSPGRAAISARSIRAVSPRRPAPASCQPSSATTSCLSPGRWHTAPGK